MANGEPFTLSLDAIMIQDPKFKGFTAYFKQFPNIITEGENENEAMINLFNALNAVFKYKSSADPLPLDDNCHAVNVIEKSVNFKSLEMR